MAEIGVVCRSLITDRLKADTGAIDFPEVGEELLLDLNRFVETFRVGFRF